MPLPFLPVCRADMDERGWQELDFVFVSGDAYVDHPSFAAALLSRWLELHGYKVGIIAQPDWHTTEAFTVLGRPRLAFLVSAGAMDSMVSNYTANNKPRSSDAYAHGGESGHRPDRALIAYTAKIREAYKGVPVLIGGIEASLRRMAHYDYWSNTVRRSILLDSKADILMYGMGEHSILELAARLKEMADTLPEGQFLTSKDAASIHGVRGTCWRTGRAADLPDAPSADAPLSEAAGANKASAADKAAGALSSDLSANKAPSALTALSEAAGANKAPSADKAAGLAADKANDASKACVRLPSYESVSAQSDEGRAAFAESYLLQEANTDAISAHVLIEQTEQRFVVQEPPALPLTTEEMDAVHEMAYTRRWHPMYDKPAANGQTGVPGLAEVQFSLTSCRGCFGACSFCAITFHQGKRIQTRSADSLVKEAEKLTKLPDFKGYIHDVGGPTANFRHDACAKQKTKGACTDRECLGANPCPAVQVDHTEYLGILRRIREIPGVKKVFVRSGIRFDYLMLDKDKTFFRELCEHHISGQLKVAPEHVSDSVLKLVRKSSHKVYEDFAAEYAKINRELGMKQYLVPYYIAGLPGAGLEEAIEVALYLKKTGFVPDQVQDFYPTPGNLATCMYYTGLNPHERDADGRMKAIYVPRGTHERRLQRALLQFNKSDNRKLVVEALEKAGRRDLLKKLL